jgi:hypothetical protein
MVVLNSSEASMWLRSNGRAAAEKEKPDSPLRAHGHHRGKTGRRSLLQTATANKNLNLETCRAPSRLLRRRRLPDMLAVYKRGHDIQRQRIL